MFTYVYIRCVCLFEEMSIIIIKKNISRLNLENKYLECKQYLLHRIMFYYVIRNFLLASFKNVFISKLINQQFYQ